MKLLALLLASIPAFAQFAVPSISTPSPIGTPAAPVTFISSSRGASSGVDTIDTDTMNVATGNSVGCIVRSSSKITSGTQITDTAGNTYSIGAAYDDGGNSSYVRWAYTIGATANASNVVHVAFSGNSLFTAIICFQVSGATGWDSGAEVGSTVFTGTTITSPSFSTANANSFIMFGGGTGTGGASPCTVGNIGGVAADGVVENAASTPQGCAVYRAVSATQSSITAAWVQSGATGISTHGTGVFYGD